MLRGWQWSEEDERAGEVSEEQRRQLVAEEAEKAEEEDEKRFQVPVELEASFTPAEVDEARALFEKLDEDKSGAVSVSELAHAFDEMEEQVSEAELRELVREADTDETGELEFGEFLFLLARFKEGGSKLAKLTNLFAQMDATPLAVLERECARRGLDLRYEIVDILAPNSMHTGQYIMCAVVSGMFSELVGDVPTRQFKEQRFEGIGKSSRASKFAAATTALSKLREHIPGIDFEPGVIPDSWMRWFEDNLDDGVPELVLLRKLTAKGFFPCKNVLFMQKMRLRVSMRRLQEQTGSAQPLWVGGEGRELPPEWVAWAQDHMRHGIHGSVILDTLIENGLIPSRNPLLLQHLQKDRGGAFSDKVRPRRFDWWECAASGLIEELERYLAGGQAVDELKSIRGHETTALVLAVRGSHEDAVAFLADAGAELDRRDTFGRTSLHTAAAIGEVEIMALLISKGGDALVQDRYGDSPLHMAAGQGKSDMVAFLADWHAERMRRFCSDKDKIAGLNGGFEEAARQVYLGVLAKRLSSFAAQDFRKQWMGQALQEFYDAFNRQPLVTVGTCSSEEAPAAAVEAEAATAPSDAAGEGSSRDVFDEADPVARFVQNDDPRRVLALAPPSDVLARHVLLRCDNHASSPILREEEFIALLRKAVCAAWVNARNLIGRTPLMLAAEPSGQIMEEHEQIMQCLMDEHGCEVLLRDSNERTVTDILEKRLSLLGESHIEELRAEAEAREEQARVQREEASEPLQNDRLYELLENEVLDQWGHLKSKASRLRVVEGYSEMIVQPSGRRFYMDSDGNCQWTKPQALVEADTEAYGWARLKLQATRLDTAKGWDRYLHKASGQVFYHNYATGDTQWQEPDARRRGREPEPGPEHDPDCATHVCTLGFWSKWRRNSDGRVYFRNDKGATQHERPLEWSSYADPTDVSPFTVPIDWDAMASASQVTRSFGAWQERRDSVTESCFYRCAKGRRGADPDAAGSWAQPRDVVRVEQGCLLHDALVGRENGRKRKRLKVLRTAEDKDTGWVWREESDLFRTQISFERRLTNAASGSSRTARAVVETVIYYVGHDPVEGRTVAQCAVPEVFKLPEQTNDNAPLPPTLLRRRSSVSASLAAANRAEDKEAQLIKRMLLRVEAANERMMHGYVLCTWGCKDWTEPSEEAEHRQATCKKRQLPCTFGCGLVLRFEQWEQLRERHERLDCPLREVPCDLLCGQLVVFQDMKQHLAEACLKRSVPPLPCSNGCGWKIAGGLEDLAAMEWEAQQHAQHECPLRITRCDWPGCMAEPQARLRAAHRQQHLDSLGISTWTTPGEHRFRVPPKCRRLLVQAWGGGGGAGVLRGRRGARGGGGGFVQAVLTVHPREELIVLVGAGGAGHDGQRHRGGYRAKGGFPGGGDGLSENDTFLCGGGGGFSAVVRQGAFGREMLAIAGGGGGGGTRGGVPGGCTVASEDADGINRSGQPGALGGAAGAVPDGVAVPVDGAQFAGGHGGLFGGGGGGGLVGGGGGGFTPGVVGGGGGGSSFIVEPPEPGPAPSTSRSGSSRTTSRSSRRSGRRQNGPLDERRVIEAGCGDKPGGVHFDLPAATELGEWDLTGKLAGYGGAYTDDAALAGSAGAVRIKLPKYFDTSFREIRIDWDEARRQHEEVLEDARSCATCITADDSTDESGSDAGSTSSPPPPVAEGDEDHDSDAEGAAYESDEEDAELPPELLAVPETKESQLVAGTRVMCHYQGKRHNPQYAGVIADVNMDGTFEIEYDDGDTDSRIAAEFIHLLA